ncbi:restriction endonuclease subunit S [Pseudomonas mendocina]|nr:restriction endonuclease subunit S [Pseudomonas mendocina]
MAKVSGEYLPLSVLGEFPSDWNESTLEEVCHQVTDGTHDSPKPVAEGGYPLVTGKAIKDRRVDFSVTYNISDAEHQKVIERSKPERDDILFANIGNSIGDLVRVQTDRPFSIKNVALFKPNPSKVSARYLEYFLLSEQVQGFIKGSTRGSAQPFIGLGSLRGFPVPLPPMNEQLSIGALLGALDDRITLLRETNATLEAIAQALFKSWFVDFDPVRAKAEGRQPEGMDAATAALFPDSFEESELGLVPKGWGIKSVAEVAEVVKGKSYTSKELAEQHDTALVTLKSFARGGGFRLDGFKPYTGSYKPAQVVVPGDLIIAYTDVTQAAELIGKPAIVIGVEDYQTLVASLDVGIVRPDIQKVSRQYLYGLFRTESFQSHTFAHTSGTTVLHLAKDGVGSYQFSCPPNEIIQSFSVITDALSERCQNNIDQVRNLTQLRDTLLPRLISGQLRLPEAEALMAEVAS